jgi:tetratricopeptide repeat protein 21B
VLEQQTGSVGAHVVAGWVALAGSDAALPRAAQHFDTALAAAGKKDIDALLGRSAVLARQRQPQAALDTLNQLSALYPFAPALIEKARVALALGDWEQATDALHRAPTDLALDKAQLSAVIALAFADRASDAQIVPPLASIVASAEPRNAAVALSAARMLSCLAVGHSGCGARALCVCWSY